MTRPVTATREFTVSIDWTGTEASDAESADIRDVALTAVVVNGQQFAGIDEAVAFMLTGVGDWE